MTMLAATETDTGAECAPLPLGQVIDAHTQFGWKAQLDLTFVDRGDKTVLKHRQQKGPLAIQRPLYPEGNPCHCYLLHPPGGVVGGDTLHIQCQAVDEAKVVVTTPGATKFYRSDATYAKQQQRLRATKGARLEWMPQENIFFPDAHVRIDTKIELESGAQFLGWEMHCFGRPALKEGFDRGHLIGKTEVFCDGQLLLSEAVNLDGQDKLMKNIGMINYSMVGTLIISIEDEHFYQLVQSLLTKVHKQHEPDALVIAATQIEGLIVVRALANWSEVMLDSFTQVWQLTREYWQGEKPTPPRIWAT